MHNDSGDTNRIFAVDAKTGQTLGTYTLQGATAKDWEDIEVATGADGKSYIYVGDIGDNAGSRSNVTIYRVLEPEVTGTASNPTNATLTGVDQLRLIYPDGSKINSEALAVDPQTNKLMVIEKTGSSVSRVYAPESQVWVAATSSSPRHTTESGCDTEYFGCQLTPGHQRRLLAGRFTIGCPHLRRCPAMEPRRRHHRLVAVQQHRGQGTRCC